MASPRATSAHVNPGDGVLAPHTALSIGSRELHRALGEQRWLAQRRAPPTAAALPRSSTYSPDGRPDSLRPECDDQSLAYGLHVDPTAPSARTSSVCQPGVS